MAVGAFTFTDPGILAVLNGTIDLDTDTIVAVLVDNAKTPSVALDDIYSDISTQVCDDAHYTAAHPNGLVVAGLAWTVTSSRNFKLDANALDFDAAAAVDIAARYVYLVRRADASLVAGDLIVGYMDLNDGGAANVASVAGAFEVDWNADNGLFTLALTP